MKRFLQVILLAVALSACSEPKIQLRAPIADSANVAATQDTNKVDTTKKITVVGKN